MTYKIDFDHWGRFFNVPCNIVDEHLRLADGDFVKVLLCIFSGGSTVDSEQIAKLSGLKASRVDDAVHYWADIGVIRVDGIPSRENSHTAVAASADVKPKNITPSAPAVKPVVRYSPKELADILEKNEELKYLTAEYEKIKGTFVKDNEILGLINLNEYYGFDAQSIMLLIEYCSKLGKTRIAYIEKVARDFFDREIISYPDVEAEIIRLSRIRSYEHKAVKALGLKGKPSTRQAAVIKEWQDKGISIEMMEAAYDICMDSISEPNFNYIAKIIGSWLEKGLYDPEEAKKSSEKNTAAKNRKNVKNAETSYDLDEWEKFAMSFDPESGGDGNG